MRLAAKLLKDFLLSLADALSCIVLLLTSTYVAFAEPSAFHWLGTDCVGGRFGVEQLLRALESSRFLSDLYNSQFLSHSICQSTILRPRSSISSQALGSLLICS